MLENGKIIEMRTMFDAKERKFEWQSLKIEVPKKYSQINLVSHVAPGAMFGKKDSCLDSLQKMKKKIPGPSQYKLEHYTQRPLSGKMDRAPRKTICEEIRVQSAKHNLPGPGAYFTRSDQKRGKTLKLSERQKNEVFKEHYLNQIMYMAVKSPGIGEYNLNTPRHVAGPKIMKKVNCSRKQLKQGKQNKQSELNYMQFMPGTFAQIDKKGKKRSSNYFGSSKRFVVGPKNEKKPAPNSYKINREWNNASNILKLTVGPSGKSVYYH